MFNYIWMYFLTKCTFLNYVPSKYAFLKVFYHKIDIFKVYAFFMLLSSEWHHKIQRSEKPTK